jgi:hypothetical protein
LDRGQLLAARGWLAKRWNWSEKQVRVWLAKLEALEMIGLKSGRQKGQQKEEQKGQQNHNTVAVLTICKYDIYQTARELEALMQGQQKGQRKGQQKGQRGASEGPELLQGIPRVQEEGKVGESLSKEESLSLVRNEVPHESEQGFYANGVAIEGDGWRLMYADVDRAADLHGVDREEAHRQALVAAEHWSRNRIEVVDPAQRFSDGLKKIQAKNAQGTATARQAMEIYNEAAKRCGLPLAQALSPERLRKITARIKEAGGIEGYKEAVQKLEKSDWCLGKSDGGWKASFDFLCQSKSFHKLREGGYDNRSVKRTTPIGRPGR